MHRLTIREILDSLTCKAELPRVLVGACLEEGVKVMVKGRRRIVYVVDAEDKLKGAIPRPFMTTL